MVFLNPKLEYWLQNQTSNLNWPPSSRLSNVIYPSSRNSLTYNNLLAQGKICNIKTCFLEHTNPRVWLLEFTLNTWYSSDDSCGRDRRSGTWCLVCDLNLHCSSLEAELSLQRQNEQGHTQTAEKLYTVGRGRFFLKDYHSLNISLSPTLPVVDPILFEMM